MAAYAGEQVLLTFYEGMQHFDLSRMPVKVTRITGPLPSSLIYLICEGNEITELPELPKSLMVLNVIANKLTKLPNLPANLKTLRCSLNKLTYLPPLPPMLETLQCGDNEITELPELPKTLRSLSCSWTKIKRLPALPPNIGTVFVDGITTFEEPFKTLLLKYTHGHGPYLQTGTELNNVRFEINKFYEIKETLGFLKNAESSYFKPLKANNDTITPKMQGLPNVVQNKIASYLTGKQGTVRNQKNQLERNLQRLRNTTAPRRAGGRQSSSRRNKTRKIKYLHHS